MKGGGPLALTKSHHEHLHQTTSNHPFEIRMGFDPVDDENAIELRRDRTPINRSAKVALTDQDGVHRRLE